jgi:hypothetical protein
MAQPSFLGDPMSDRIMQVVMNLAEEMYVTRYRMQIMERVLDKKGLLKSVDIESFEPDEIALAEMRKSRDEFIEKLLDSVVRTPDQD